MRDEDVIEYCQVSVPSRNPVLAWFQVKKYEEELTRKEMFDIKIPAFFCLTFYSNKNRTR